MTDLGEEGRLDPVTSNIPKDARPGDELAGRVCLIKQDVLPPVGVVVGAFSADNEYRPESWLAG